MSRRWVAWVPAAIWAAVLFFASSRPTIDVDLSGGLDKVAHLGAYLCFGVLLMIGTASHRLPAIVAIGLGLTYGVLDEFHQSFVPGRSAEFADWVADALGTLIGVLLFIRFRRHRAGWRAANSS